MEDDKDVPSTEVDNLFPIFLLVSLKRSSIYVWCIQHKGETAANQVSWYIYFILVYYILF